MEGRDIVFEKRSATATPNGCVNLRTNWPGLKVDVIIAPSSIYTDAARRATTKIPIIFLSHADPLGSGHVSSLSRPGGNITGLSLMMTETNVKGLELFKEVIPQLSRVAVIWDPETPSHRPGMNALNLAVPPLGLEIQSVPVASATEYDGHFRQLKKNALAGSWFFDPTFHCRSKEAGRTLAGAKATVTFWAKTACRGWGTYELLARPPRLMASRCDLRGQNPARH